MKNIISLPNFGGFYGEEFTDRWIECEAEHIRDEHPDFTDEQIDTELSEIDYSKTYTEAASLCVYGVDGYRERLMETFPFVTDVTFERLDSPKYYNFRTDEIHAVVEYDYITLQHHVFVEEREAFEAWLKENYSSRDGFISFVETDVQDFIEEYKNEQQTPEWSKCLTVIFEFLCRDWETVIPDAVDGIWECVSVKDKQ